MRARWKRSKICALLLRGDADAGVGHGGQRRAALRTHGERHRAALRRELHRVVEQVGEHGLQPRPLDGHGERACGRRRPRARRRPAPRGRRRRPPARRATAARSVLCGAPPAGSPASRRESWRRLSESVARRAVWTSARSTRRRSSSSDGLALGQLEVGLQRRERRADLVGRVGDEAAQRRHGGLHARRHAVEGLAEAPDLVAAGDGRAGAEVAAGHPVAGLRERDHRPRDAPRPPGSRRGRRGRRRARPPGSRPRRRSSARRGRTPGPPRASRRRRCPCPWSASGLEREPPPAAEQAVAQRVRQPVVVAEAVAVPVVAAEERLGVELVG